MKTKKIGFAVALTAVAVIGLVTPLQVSAVDTSVSSVISSVLSVFTSNGSVALNVTPTVAGAQTIASDQVTVSANGPGYTLQLSDKDTTTSLVSGSNTITASTGRPATPAALTAGKWGYRVDGMSSFGAGPTSALSSGAIAATTFAGVPSSASPDTLKDTSVAASNDVTTVWYSVAANTTQATGTYADTVTYTAVAK